MQFRSVAVVKHPVEDVWPAMRDRLPEVAAGIASIASVSVESRRRLEDGGWRIVKVWRAAPPLPDFVARRVSEEMLSWTETGSWDESDLVCRWTIEPHHLRGRLQPRGTTTFGPAMGGRGTRLTFAGDLPSEAEAAAVPGWDAIVGPGVGPLIQRVVPTVFRTLADGLQSYLDEEGRPSGDR